MSKVKALYLSRTDINVDSRILESMAAAEEKNFSVFGIGVKGNYTMISSSTSSRIKSISLIAKKFTFIPKGLIHFLSAIEFAFRVLPHALKFRPCILHCNDPNSLPTALLSYLPHPKQLSAGGYEVDDSHTYMSLEQRVEVKDGTSW